MLDGDGESVTGGNKRRVQARKVRKGGFSEAKRQVVLDHLAACSNLTRAAAAAGVSTVTVNYHRRRDPAFARACAEAIEAGYDALEAMAIDRAAHGGGYRPGETPVGDAGTIDPDMALQLLRLRRAPIGQRTGRAGYEPKRASEKELKEAILAGLDLLEKRLRARGNKAAVEFRAPDPLTPTIGAASGSVRGTDLRPRSPQGRGSEADVE